MRFLSALAFASLASAAATSTADPSEEKAGRYGGPEIWGSKNAIDDYEMHEAIECLHRNVCSRRKVPYQGKIRCTIGTSVAYLCNYRSNRGEKEDKKDSHPGDLYCSAYEMYEAWRQIRIARSSQTGWWHDKKSKKTYGFDRRCKANECDNGWKIGSEGEQCTNIRKGLFKKEPDWLFDYEADDFVNYTGKYAQKMPAIDDPTEPMYFNPWKEAKRPQ